MRDLIRLHRITVGKSRPEMQRTCLSPSDQNAEGDLLEMEKKIREATQSENVIIMGDFHLLHTDCLNACLGCAKETKFLATRASPF